GRPVILATCRLPGEAQARLGRDYAARLRQDDAILPPSAIVEAAPGADGLLIAPTDRLSAETIAALPPGLRIIATVSVGFEHIDIAAAAARGITVTNTPDVLSAATADLAMLLLLGAARGAHWGQAMIRDNAWTGWRVTGPLGVEVSGKRLGILGLGRIGRAMARRARGFDMEIHYHGRARLAPELEQDAIFHPDLLDFLSCCDFLSIHAALNDQTRGMISARELAALPGGAILVNTARGDIIDDDALIASLKSRHLAAAGLDVFRGEPNIDPRLRALDNVFLLPHLGSATIETRNAMAGRALDNLDAFFAGRTPPDRVAG
ncbi:MAG: D-glycerate dehydrogenase, partial [Rhodobiaceae bacterium]|nr:D-glycerate dehydrogenase [Rhodobiaceae bacterium]